MAQDVPIATATREFSAVPDRDYYPRRIA